FHLALVLGLIFLVFPRPRPARNASALAKEWGWALSFAAFYVYLAWDLVVQLSASGELKQGWAFFALVTLLAAITLPLRRFGGFDDKPSWTDWPLALFAA